MTQVLDIERMQHLRDLSLDISKASMCWLKMNDVVRLSVHDEYCYESSLMEAMPAFTLQDIIDMLPYMIEDYFLFFQKDRYTFTGGDCYHIYYRQSWRDYRLKEIHSDNFIDAAYEMLCWVIENGYLEDKK